jgi:hypothetical protein
MAMRMSVNRIVLFCSCLLLAATVNAAQLPCDNPGEERWPVKITVPADPKHQTMSLTDALNLARLNDVRKDDPRYADKRITDQPVKEDTMVTTSGWLYLVAFEKDDCDFHIQISTKPFTSANLPTKEDNSMIVEVSSGQYATTISDQVEGVRQWVIDNLLAKKPPTIGSVHVMQHPVYVTVTGALFYDDAHVYLADGSTQRGKKGLESKTLWELHPVTSMAFAPKPTGN